MVLSKIKKIYGVFVLFFFVFVYFFNFLINIIVSFCIIYINELFVINFIFG